MLKRRLIWLLIAGVVLLGVLVLICNREPTEPEYRGKKLSEWVDMLPAIRPANDDTEAAKAIQQIGTNAVPHLIKWISYQPGLLRITCYGVIQKFKKGTNPWAWDTKNRLAIKAVGGFQILGLQANAAIPELGRLMNSLKHQERAVAALGYLGPDALPILLPALTNRDLMLGWHAFRAIKGMGTNAAPAIPALMEYLRQENIVGVHAGDILANLKAQSRLAVPALQKSLRDSSVGVRWAAAHVLAECASEARLAVPALVQALDDPDPSVRQEAGKALGQIDPQALEGAKAR